MPFLQLNGLLPDETHLGSSYARIYWQTLCSKLFLAIKASLIHVPSTAPKYIYYSGNRECLSPNSLFIITYEHHSFLETGVSELADVRQKENSVFCFPYQIVCL